MATTRQSSVEREIEYPTSDGRPMAETQTHAQDMIDLIQTLQDHFAADPEVYVWGNLMLFYERGNPRKHVSPDVMVVRGIPKEPPRDYHLVWEEGKGPDVVIEITSKTTRREDQRKKHVLYRDVLKVPEYFTFDPTDDYLKPALQGHRLVDGEYLPIAPVADRLPSAILGLHLEREQKELRLFEPATGRRLLTRTENGVAARQKAVVAENRAAETETENERLRREIEALRRLMPGEGS